MPNVPMPMPKGPMVRALPKGEEIQHMEEHPFSWVGLAITLVAILGFFIVLLLFF